jgi:hypothetical protein
VTGTTQIQPTDTQVRATLEAMLQIVAGGASMNDPKGVGIAMKAACGAALGSAAATMQ